MFVVLPGFAASSYSAYYTLIDWAALDAAHINYAKLAKSPISTLKDLTIAEAAENRHRINCFAEGVGALLGWGIVAIGIHGLCTLPRSSP
jgi:hypothetical protein